MKQGCGQSIFIPDSGNHSQSLEVYGLVQVLRVPTDPFAYLSQLGYKPKLQEALAKVPLPDYECPATDFLRRLVLLSKGMNQDYLELILDALPSETLASWLQRPPVSNNWFEIPRDLGILPTPTLLSYIQGGKDTEARNGLERTIEEIKEGGFDPSNSLHVELEYSKYKTKGFKSRAAGLSLRDFVKLPWIEGKDVVLTEEEYEYAVRTAEEAVAVLNLVKEKQANSQNPLLVIANARYGLYYVVSPIEDYLNEMSVKVVREYVRSFAYDKQPRFEKLSEPLSSASISRETWRWIVDNNPDIVVVDGTQNTESYIESINTSCTRFPAAMWGYINAFRAYNTACSDKSGIIPESLLVEQLRKMGASCPYNIGFWAPDRITKKIYVGDYAYQSRISGKEERELTLVNSTSSELDGSFGYFDDPEKRVKGEHRLGFNSHGLCRVPTAPTESALVAELQKIMKEHIAEWLS